MNLTEEEKQVVVDSLAKMCVTTIMGDIKVGESRALRAIDAMLQIDERRRAGIITVQEEMQV